MRHVLKGGLLGYKVDHHQVCHQESVNITLKRPMMTMMIMMTAFWQIPTMTKSHHGRILTMVVMMMMVTS